VFRADIVRRCWLDPGMKQDGYGDREGTWARMGEAASAETAIAAAGATERNQRPNGPCTKDIDPSLDVEEPTSARRTGAV
jgi:hypothetical protein